MVPDFLTMTATTANFSALWSFLRRTAVEACDTGERDGEGRDPVADAGEVGSSGGFFGGVETPMGDPPRHQIGNDPRGDDQENRRANNRCAFLITCSCKQICRFCAREPTQIDVDLRRWSRSHGLRKTESSSLDG